MPGAAKRKNDFLLIFAGKINITNIICKNSEGKYTHSVLSYIKQTKLPEFLDQSPECTNAHDPPNRCLILKYCHMIVQLQTVLV